MVKRIKTVFLSGWPIFLSGSLLTCILSYYVYTNVRQEDDLKFEFEIERAIRRIKNRMERYEGILIQTRAFFQSSGFVTQEEFNIYFRNTEILKRYPGIQGLGFALRVPQEKLQTHIQNVRRTNPKYDIWPKGERENYFSIMYLEPMNWRNQRALGYDMFTEPNRRDAMERAWETGRPVLSGKITLVQEDKNEQQPGFNLYVPYYGKNGDLAGFIYSPFRTYDLFATIFKKDKLNYDIEIFDGGKASLETLIYDHDGKRYYPDTEIKKVTRNVVLSGRPFLLSFVSMKDSGSMKMFMFPIVVFVAGILITILVFRIFWITKKQADASLASEEALQEALWARDEFISVASHEMKTPLTSMKLQAQMIKRALERNNTSFNPLEKLKTLVDQTDRQTERLERLINDMLDISRIRTGKLTIHKEEFEFSELVKDVIQRMKEQFYEIPGGTPFTSYCENSQGSWDKMRIEQVITNLLTNSIKYGNKQKIEVYVEGNKDMVLLKVKDYGLGISKEFQEKIFRRFERGGISAKEISGLGLGLYITQQIVKSHGGKIWVESAIGKGSTFYVELPRKSASV